MTQPEIVLLKTAVLFGVIVAGALARRMRLLDAGSTAALGRLAVDVCLPALAFVQMLRSADAASLHAEWYAPMLGLAILLAGQAVGAALAWIAHPPQRRTFVFLVAIGNWIYLPLPIAEALYGAEGVRSVLLFNVGATVGLWTMGVWTLRGGRFGLDLLASLARNAGLLGTLAGIAAAALVPGIGDLARTDPVALTWPWAAAAGGVQVVDLVGAPTIPLSLLFIGSMLAEAPATSDRRALAGVVAARLAITPAAVLGALVALRALGLDLPAVPLRVAALVASMPVAVSCGLFTARFGGDTPLAARSTFVTTLVGIGSVPAFFWLAERVLS